MIELIPPGRKEWPPSRPEEHPTATPLYIAPPSNRNTPIPSLPSHLVDNNTNFESIETNEIMKQTTTSEQEFSNSESHAIDISQVSESAFAHKMSICSSEVTSITEKKIGNIIESLDTQKVVDGLLKHRPTTPPPIKKAHKHKKLKLDSGCESIEELSSCGQKCNPKECKNSKCCKVQSEITCPLKQEECPLFVKNLEKEVTKESMSSAMATESLIMNAVPQEWKSPMVKALTIASDKPFNSVSINIETMERNPQNLSETHISSIDVTAQTEEYMKEHQHSKHEHKHHHHHHHHHKHKHEKHKHQDEEFIKEETKEASKEQMKQVQFPHATSTPKISSSAFTKALTIAPSQPFSPSPQITMEHIPLPEETVPYFPPEHPIISIEPKPPKQVPTCKSPFVEALTTAPERPYTPVASKTQPKESSDYMKDLPAPPKEKISMLAALTVATDRPFTPVLFGSDTKAVTISDQPVQPIQQPSPIPQIQSPVPVKTMPRKSLPMCAPIFPAKPASHLSPSAFTPLGTSKFVPVPENYLPGCKEIPPPPPQPIISFPPVSELIKSKKSLPPSQVVYEREYKQQVNPVGEQFKKELKQSGLHTANSIPCYQKNIQAPKTQPPIPTINVPTFDQYEQEPPKPVQKPVTTLKPGQYQSNIPHTSFQPVQDDHDGYHLKTTHPVARSISPSMINKAAPPIPHYQQHLVAEEHFAVGSNLFDPRSPAVSRTPSPVMGRSPSPYGSPYVPRVKSPAPGPPVNPLEERWHPKPKPLVKDARYFEAKDHINHYVPKTHVSRVEQLKRESFASPPLKQLEKGSGCEVYQSHYSHPIQYSSENCKVTGHEDVKHLQAMSKMEMHSVEKSPDNLVQVERRKKTTEEFERTQKVRTVEIERSSTGVAQVRSAGVQRYEATMPKQVMSNRACPQTPPRSPVCKTSTAPPSRSYSLPASVAAKPSKSSSLVQPNQPASTNLTSVGETKPSVPQTPFNIGTGGKQAGAIGVSPKRGRGILNMAASPGSRIPLCASCSSQIRYKSFWVLLLLKLTL